MNPKSVKRSKVKLIAAAVSAVALVGTVDRSDASLVVDLTAVATSGGAVLINNKNLLFTAPGQTVTLRLTAQIRGTDSIAQETVSQVQGSIVSTGATLGNFSFGSTRDDGPGAVNSSAPGTIVNSNVIDPFDAPGFSDGQFVDLDGDGDLDLGSTGASTSGYFVALSPSETPGTNVGNGSPNAGDNRVLGNVIFTYTGGGAFVDFYFITRKDVDGTPLASAATWTEDGVTKNPTTGAYAAGIRVSHNVPEPSALALAALAAMGMVVRRRTAI